MRGMKRAMVSVDRMTRRLILLTKIRKYNPQFAEMCEVNKCRL
jgi:hypothetical protein